MRTLAFDVAHLLAGGMLVMSFVLLYQTRITAMLNVFAIQAIMLSLSVAWQSVIPLALLVVVVDSFMVYFNRTSWPAMLAANGAMLVVMLVVQPLLPAYTSNRKLPLYGSRFNPVPGERVVTGPTHAAALEDRPVEGTAASVG